MKKIFTILVLASLMTMGGCVTLVGANFNRQSAALYVPGETAKSEVLAAMGPPKESKTYTVKKDLSGKELPAPMVMESVRYYFQDNLAEAVNTEIEPSRSAWFQFAGEKLVSFVTRSSFKADSTDFDENLVKNIEKNKTTEAEVIRLFGRPSGASIYPNAKEIGGTGIIYETFQFNKNTRKGTSKRLAIFFNSKKVVTDFDLNITNR